MTALSLKTKLVIAITAMAVAIVVTLSQLEITEGVRRYKIDENDPRQLEEAWQELLQTDWVVNALLDSVSGDSHLIYDAAIVDTKGVAVLHTNSGLLGTVVEPREDFNSLLHADIRQQLRAIYGPIKVYDERIPVLRNGHVFGEVRVGVANSLLRDELQPLMSKALKLSGSAILACLILAAVLSNLALPPLAATSRRLA